MNVFFIVMMILLVLLLPNIIVLKMGREVLLFQLCRLKDESLTPKNEGCAKKGFLSLTERTEATESI
jgi:hypothetical protein